MKFKQPVPRKVFLKDVGLPLELDDEQDPSWVEVRQATQAEQVRRLEAMPEATSIFEDDKRVAYKQKWNSAKQMQTEIYLALSGAGALDLQDERDETKFAPAFRFFKESGVTRLNMTEDEFSKAIGRLPAPVVEAIHGAVLLENEQWNPNL